MTKDPTLRPGAARERVARGLPFSYDDTKLTAELIQRALNGVDPLFMANLITAWREEGRAWQKVGPSGSPDGRWRVVGVPPPTNALDVTSPSPVSIDLENFNFRYETQADNWLLIRRWSAVVKFLQDASK